MEGTLVVDESPWSDPARCRGESAALRDLPAYGVYTLYSYQSLQSVVTILWCLLSK